MLCPISGSVQQAFKDHFEQDGPAEQTTHTTLVHRVWNLLKEFFKS